MPSPVGKKTQFIGVPTTTPVAFVHGGEPHLERMNLLALDGAGILTEQAIPVGTRLRLAFRLSTATAQLRCSAEVRGGLPTTPAGMRLQEKLGDKGLPAIMGASGGDSATAIFRMEDLERMRAEHKHVQAAGPQAHRKVSTAKGICVAFIALDEATQAAVRHHIETSRALAQRLAAGGRSDSEDRLAISDTFHEGDLSKRALDW